jgi:hypothetical protein
MMSLVFLSKHGANIVIFSETNMISQITVARNSFIYSFWESAEKSPLSFLAASQNSNALEGCVTHVRRI